VDAPTGALIRQWAPPLLDWTAYGFEEPWGTGADPLDARASWAAGQLYADTGRTLASIVLPEEVAIAQQILVAFTVMGAQGGSAAALEVAEAPWLKSFTAGSYSETRFAPSELAGTGGAPYPQPLWNLLWSLMTDAKRDDWTFRLSGQHAPAGTFVGVDWGGHHHSHPAVWGPGIENWW
jgi:hypothetical protein